MDCAFQVGDEIVCTNHDGPGDGWSLDPKVQVPQIGDVCKVRSLFAVPPGYLESGSVLVRLWGFSIESNIGGEAGFPSWWFRKVEKPKRETSIETFRQIDREVFEKITVPA